MPTQTSQSDYETYADWMSWDYVTRQIMIIQRFLTGTFNAPARELVSDYPPLES